MSTARRTLRDRISAAATVGAYRSGALAARLMPGPVADGVAMSVGAGSAWASPDKRRIIERNLRRVDPTLSGIRLRRMSQQAFESYARYYVESFRVPMLSPRAVARNFVLDGFEHVERSVAAGKGTILALPHLGGWEWAGRWMTDHGFPMTVVVEALEPPELFEWFAGLRADLGMTIVPTGPDAGATVLRALRDNEVVCLLCDRDLERNGVEVEFFGERTTLPAGPATLGIRTGAAILPVAVYFDSLTHDGHFTIVRPPLDTTRHGGLRADVARVTQDLASELEVLIRRHPEQWHLFQPNWPSDPGY